MYDPFLIAKLNDREWRLFGALLLTGQQSVVLKRREVLARSGLNKNNLNQARAELVEKGLIAVRALGADGIEYTIPHRDTFWQATEVPTEETVLAEPRKMVALPSPKHSVDNPPKKEEGSGDVALVIAAYADLFPVDAQYPLTKQKAKDMLARAKGKTDHVIAVFNRVALKPDVKAPKAYILSILDKEKPPADEPGATEIEPVYYALMNRRNKKHGTLA